MENQSSLNDQFLRKIHQHIEDNLDNENFSVEDLAKNIGISRSMLHRKLIKLTGKSAGDLIKETRLKRAKTLLEKDVGTVSEIAYQVGFTSPSYFNKVFKKHYKVCPGEVRKGALVHSNEQNFDMKQENLFSSSFKSLKPKHFGIILILVLNILIMGLYFYDTMYGAENSIAVLPLNNLTGQDGNDCIMDGIHDALIHEFGEISSLRVISRTSTLRYRESDMSLKEIADELSVKHIVKGAVIGVSDSVRINIQLIDVFPKERLILENEYHDDMANVLTIQSKAVKDIAQKINIKLLKKEEQHMAQSHLVNPETYKAYLCGMYHLHQGTKESFKTGIKYLRQAIEYDPGDPFAYAGLAQGYTFLRHGQADSEDALPLAMSAANKAIKLDPTKDDAHTALSVIYLYHIWDWTKAKKAFENALDNNPNNQIAHAHFAWYHFLFDNIENSIFHARKAVMIEPLSAAYSAWLAILYCHNKEYDKAEYRARKALDLEKDAPYGNMALGWIYLQKKQYRQAVEFHERLPENGTEWKAILGYTYLKAGQREKALALWHELEELSKKQWVNSCYRGMMAAYLGFTDEAFELLNDACKNKYYPITYINFFPCTEDIRNDPRYNILLQKMNLPRRKAEINMNQ